MKIINKILGTVISVLVAVMVLACCWQVITRFLLNDPSQWTEEFLRYALIWMTMLGARTLMEKISICRFVCWWINFSQRIRSEQRSQ